VGRPTLEGKAPKASAPVASASGLEQLLVGHDDSRNVFLHGAVDEASIASVVAQLLHLAEENRKKPIYLVVSTYGGSIDEMFTLYDTIKFLLCPVHTVGLGKVMSAGVLLLAAGVKGHRLMGARARIMMHSASGASMGNVFEVENEARELRRLHELAIDMLVAETKMKRPEVEAIMDPKVDRYLMPEEAVRLGIVDRIIGA